MCRNLVYTYPNTFAETFCISVLEAQAAGMAVVTSNRAGLAERITNGVNGFLIDGEPGDHSYRRSFIDLVEVLLTQPHTWQQISDNAVATARPQTYTRLAADWQDRFTRELRARENRPLKPAVIPRDIVIPHPRDRAKDTQVDAAMLSNLIRVGTRGTAPERRRWQASGYPCLETGARAEAAGRRQAALLKNRPPAGLDDANRAGWPRAA